MWSFLPDELLAALGVAVREGRAASDQKQTESEAR